MPRPHRRRSQGDGARFGNDLRGLRALAEERALRRYLCVSLERRHREVDGVVILPWAEFLERLWGVNGADSHPEAGGRDDDLAADEVTRVRDVSM